MPKSIFTPRQERLQRLLRESRVAAGLTQTKLAKKLGQPQSFVSKYESGERRLDLVELRDICRALKVSLTRFVEKFDKSARQ